MYLILCSSKGANSIANFHGAMAVFPILGLPLHSLANMHVTERHAIIHYMYITRPNIAVTLQSCLTALCAVVFDEYSLQLNV